MAAYLLQCEGIPVYHATRQSSPTACTRQSMHHVAIQRSDILMARFMTEISMYDLAMLIWFDETGCDECHTKRKQSYSICKLLM